MLTIEIQSMSHWFKKEDNLLTICIIFDSKMFEEFAHYFKQLGLKGIYINDTDMYDCDFKRYYNVSTQHNFDNYSFVKFVKVENPKDKNLYIECNERFGNFTITSNKLVNLIPKD